MARRWRNYKRKFYTSRAYKFGRRAYRKSGLQLSTEFLAGAAIGLTNFDQKIPAEIKLIAACAPVKGLGKIKALAQGMIIGDIIQARTGFGLFTGGNGGSGGAI